MEAGVPSTIPPPCCSSQEDVYPQDSSSNRKVTHVWVPGPTGPVHFCLVATPHMPFFSNLSSTPSTPASQLPFAPIFWCPSMSHLMPGTASHYSRSIWSTVFCLRQILPFLLAPFIKPSLNILHPTISCSGVEMIMLARLAFPESRRKGLLNVSCLDRF